MTITSKTRLAAERARERDIYSYYPVSLHIPTSTDAPLSSGHRPPRPCPSSDSVLTALAQLGALRLHASRCLISLIDSQSQIILTEATPTLPLRTHGPRDDHAHDLWLGSAIVRRQGALCETVLSSGDHVVINDLQTDDRFKDGAFVQGPPHARFYAGVPLISAAGRILGVYCIIDDHPRNGLDDDQLLYMQDAAATVVSYLAASCAQDTNSKAEQMVRGLTSFTTGAPDLQNSAELDVPRQPEDPSNTFPLPSRPHACQSTPSDQSTEQGDDDNSVSLQDQILPPGSKRMFSRAANIMRESCNLQGVIFFDASIANSNQPDISPPNHSTEESDTDYLISSSAADDSSESNPSSDSTGTALTTCKILGFADAGRSSRDGNSPRRDYLGLSEAALRRLLNRHPDGKIFHIPRGDFDKPTRRRKGKSKGKTAIDVIVDVANNARSAAIVPLWDFERQRWFAGCLCWTSTPSRLLTYGSDLLYLRVFGHSVMSELSRLESIAVDHAKTTFIESMSHELRSPLHGILGGVEYLQNTSLDAFHISILSSISMCGRTLLDTVSNVLEYSKINENTGPQDASPGGMRRQRLLSSSPPPPSVDICQLTEETVEAVAAGQSYNLLSPQDYNEDDYFSKSISPRSPKPERPLRKTVRIILDMPHRSSWSYLIQPGIWRRILMNIFGNAMKFTFDGFVRVSLRAVEADDEHSEITLSVMDSGVGMSPGYVQEGLFKPFSQETSFSSGTGLGMSIVKRLVRSIDGEISVQSQAKAGTEVKIRVILQKGIRISSNRDLESTVAARTKEMPVALFREEVPPNDGSLSLYALSERYFHSSLSNTLEAWFGIRVTNTDDISSSSSQLILYPGPNFNASFQQRSQVGVSVVVALDGIEATTLRNDSRVIQGQVEVITQPCGPFKLAKILDHYIFRLDTDGTTPPLQPDITRMHSPAPDAELGTVSLPFDLRPPIKARHQATLPEAHSFARISSNESPQHHSLPDSYPTPIIALHTPAPLDTERSPTPTQFDADNEPSSASSSTHEQRKQSIQCDAPPSTSLPTASAAPPPKHILIVDDNPLNLRLLSAFLRKNNLPHESANNGLEALNLFKEDPERWSAVLMDLSMPVMDGVSATREIRAWERKCADEKVSNERDRRGSEAGGALNTVQEWKRRDVVRDEVGKGREVEMDEAETKVAQGDGEDERVDEAADVPEMAVSPPILLENEEGQQTPVADTAATIAAAPSSLLRDGVQIIVITGLGSATARFEATSAGADVFMTKPIQFTALMQTLKERL